MAHPKLPRSKPPSRREGAVHRVGRAAPAAVTDPEMLRVIAIHEAGHAVVACVLGLDLVGVDIIPRRHPDGRETLGYTEVPTRHTFPETTADDLMPHLVQIAAGASAEFAETGRSRRSSVTGWEGDMKAMDELLVCVFCFEGARVDGQGRLVFAPEVIERNRGAMNRVRSAADYRAEALVKEHIVAIVRVAEALQERKSLTGAEVAAIVAVTR